MEMWAQAVPNKEDSLTQRGKNWCPNRAAAQELEEGDGTVFRKGDKWKMLGLKGDLGGPQNGSTFGPKKGHAQPLLKIVF